MCQVLTREVKLKDRDPSLEPRCCWWEGLEGFRNSLKTFQAYSIHIPLPLYRWDVRKHYLCLNITLYKWRIKQRYRETKWLHTVDREPGPRQETKTPSQLIWKLNKINFLFLLFQRMFLHMVAFLTCVNIIVLTIIFLLCNHSFYEFISNLWVYQFISNCIDNYIPFL